MSLDAMDWVWEHSQSKGVGRLVMLAIADKALPPNTGSDQPMDCKAYASLTFLQKRANCTREAVTAALAVMYASGELELVPGEKGPYGAAVYRLPKAIGYVRETRGERSARRTDTGIGRLTRPIGDADRSAHPTNPAHDGQEIGRLSRPGVVGSADQLEPESVGSADHTTSSSPKNPPPPAAPHATTAQAPATGEEGRFAANDLNRTRLFLMTLRAPWTLGPLDAERIAPQLLAAAQEQGWDLNQQLADELTTNPGGILDYAATLAKKRIPNLRPHAAVHQPRTSMPDWCGQCNRGERPAEAGQRYIELPDGRDIKCPRCHPGATPAAA